MTTQSHGIQRAWMDRTANPGEDFNRFANGAWIDATVIPNEYSKWGTFYVLRDRVVDTLHTMFKNLNARSLSSAAETPLSENEMKIGDFWHAGMDEASVEAAGSTPILSELNRINSVSTTRMLAEQVARLHRYGINVFFGFGAGSGVDDSSKNMAHAMQGGLGLPNRDYYLDEDESTVAIRQQYVAHVQAMFELLGDKPSVARKHAASVLAIETVLARASMSDTDQRSPENVRHKMSVDEFKELFSAFPVGRYFRDLHGDCTFDTMNVAQPEFFKALNELLKTEDYRRLKVYMRWHLVNSTASYLSSKFVNADFEFYGKTLSGRKALQPRWKRVVDATNGALGEAVGQLYVAEVFAPEAKATVLRLVENLRAALKEAITAATWLAEATRESALVKLAAFEAMIGYPDKWLDYSELKVTRTSFLQNVLRARQMATGLDLAKIGQPVDRQEWHMSPQTVNAYYSPDRNQIVFPAAILQPPFFDPYADDASNYGGIGVVIGHEMTHGFDDEGSKYDAQGNLKNWWTDSDNENFAGRIARIVEQFGSFTVAGGVPVNGKLVAGEAASDLGGVKLALSALRKQLALAGMPMPDPDGFTDEQRFFIAFAQLWAAKSRPEAEALQVKTDPHPPAQFRVNGTLANVGEFADAFALPADAPMMLPEAKRCRLW